MLVEEGRDGPSGTFVYIENLVEQLGAGIHLLSKFVGRILAVLTHEDYGIDCELRASESKRLPNRWIDFEAMLRCKIAAHVIRRCLVGIEGNHMAGRLAMNSIHRVAAKQPS